MSLSLIASQVSVLFILLGIGLILKKVNLITDELNKGLSSLIIYATLPALIITSMNYEFSKDMFTNGMKVLGIGFFVYLFVLLLGFIFSKVFHIENPQKGVYLFLLMFSNVGFMGYPITEVVFGKIGVFYAAIFNIWFNILIWTLGVLLLNPKKKNNLNFKSLLNPGTISLFIGFFLFIFSLKLPKPLFMALDSLGKATTPLAMMVVGSLLGDVKISNIIKNKKLLIVSLLRLIIIPLTVLLLLLPFNLEETIMGVIVLIVSMPSAANAAIFARRYDSDYSLASQGVFITTLFSIVSIPLIIFIMSM
ncbi:MAG: AEC family transporter [Firmicutes bacterium]|nr:AEC family transporter [Bacillota bacterium]